MATDQEDRGLLTLKEFSAYTGMGMTKAREVVLSPRCPFRFYVGRKILVKKKALDRFLEENSSFHY